MENADVLPLEVGDGKPRPGTLRCVMMARGFFCDGMGVPLKGRGAVMTLLAVSLENRTVRRGGASQHLGAGRGSAGLHNCDMMLRVGFVMVKDKGGFLVGGLWRRARGAKKAMRSNEMTP